MSTVHILPQDTLRRIQRVQAITVAWMSAEAGLSLWAAWRARSPALAAFGGDSGFELLSAVVVLWRFRAYARPTRSGALRASPEGCCSRLRCSWC